MMPEILEILEMLEMLRMLVGAVPWGVPHNDYDTQ